MIRKAFTSTVFIILLLLVSLTPTNAIYASYSEDVTASAFYIESSHYAVNNAGYAFNDNLSYWYSGESGAGVYGVSYLGQDFGEYTVYEIRRVGYLGYGTSAYSITSYLLQYSSNGADWNTCGVATIAVIWQEQYSNFPACGTYRYWRLLANSSTGSSYWMVIEIEMFEYIEDPTPTIAATPTNTPFPLAYQSTLSSGVAYEIERSATFGEIALFAIMAFISVILLVMLFVRIASNATANS